jgi:hypothetical protein
MCVVCVYLVCLFSLYIYLYEWVNKCILIVVNVWKKFSINNHQNHHQYKREREKEWVSEWVREKVMNVGVFMKCFVENIT